MKKSTMIVTDPVTNQEFDLLEWAEIQGQDLLDHEKLYNEKLAEYGITAKYKICKIDKGNVPIFTIKSNKRSSYKFLKVFKSVSVHLIENINLDGNCKIFLFSILPFISFPSNEIIHKNRNPSLEDFEIITGLSRNTLYKCFNHLMDEDILARVKRSGQTIYIVNPYIICAGFGVNLETYVLFRHSIYNTDRQANTG